MMQCTMGSAPASLIATQAIANVNAGYPTAANIMDHKPMVNIPPFGTCSILTASASGVPTPCVPATAAPWVKGSSTILNCNFPTLNDTSKCICNIGGSISITYAGQTSVDTD